MAHKLRIANLIVLHFFDELDISTYRDWFYYAESWFAKHDFIPDRIGGKGDKVITFKRGKANLEKANFSYAKESGLWLGKLLPEDQVYQESTDVYLSAFLSMFWEEDTYKDNFCDMLWDDAVIPWDNRDIHAMVRDLYDLLKPRYGYVLQRPFRYGHESYAEGVICGIDNYKEPGRTEANQLTSWGIIGCGRDHPLYRPYMIRDIYRINYLNPDQLGAILGGITLEKWILSHQNHGILEEIAPDFYSWTIEPEVVDRIREALKPYNILIAYMKY